MAIIYTGYEREIAAWLQGKNDAFTRAYAASIMAGRITDTAENNARAAVRAYIEQFPEPEFPDDYD